MLLLCVAFCVRHRRVWSLQRAPWRGQPLPPRACPHPFHLPPLLRQLEDAAVAAREAATMDLLRELEQEEAAKKVGAAGRKLPRRGGGGAACAAQDGADVGVALCPR